MSTSLNLPEGYQSITPYFAVNDADRLIAFLCDAFGAVVIKDSRYHDGRIQHARVRIGSSILMMNQRTDTYPANTSQMHLYVEDTDASYGAALKQVATSLMKPNVCVHGDRMAGVTDPCGNI